MPDVEQPPEQRPAQAPEQPSRLSLPPPAPELVERARAFRDAGVAPAPAKASATVILLRDRAGAGVEVFMIRRLVAMSFAGGMHVFPGGVVDPADAIRRSADEAVVVAAIRETFEETGLLLASGPAPDADALEADRLALVSHEVTFDDVLARHALAPRPDWLRAWSRWVTPEFEPRRYDTHFFVALQPRAHDARHVGGESDAATWVTPADALAASARGDWLLMPPTATTLRELLPYPRAAEVFEAAAQRVVGPLQVSIDLDADPPRFVV